MANQRAVTSTTGGTAARRAAKVKGTSGTGPATRSPAAPPGQAPRRVTRRELDPDTLAALEEERDFLLTSLRDLEREHDAGDVDDADYDALKDDYTARAAAVIRRIDDRQARVDEVFADRPRSLGRVAAWVIGAVVVAVLAGVLVAQASGRRTAGDSVSGDIRQSSRDLLLKAQDQFGNGQLLDAIKTYDQVLELQPANREALTYKGWLLYRASASAGGQLSPQEVQALRDRAVQSLDQAVSADPTYADAHIFRAIIAKDAGRYDDALAELDQVPADQVPEFMRTQVDQLRQTARNGGSTPSTGSAPSAVPR